MLAPSDPFPVSEEFLNIWPHLTRTERMRLRVKAAYEHISLLAAYQGWPDLIRRKAPSEVRLWENGQKAPRRLSLWQTDVMLSDHAQQRCSCDTHAVQGRARHVYLGPNGATSFVKCVQCGAVWEWGYP